ncbi:MAG TPA: recombinase RecT [Hanamia sp.]|nr:recombinase RecT [Hanamia sp.]
MTEVKMPVAPAQTNGQQIAKKEFSHSERFTQAVEREFSGGVGEVNLTGFQRKLIQNYFIKIDSLFKESEIKRLAKDEKYREPVPYTWENINLTKLAVDVISYSGVGLDPTQDNHINPIPYKNKHTGKYDITFIVGYKGEEVKAKKYGMDIPDEVVVELVYEKDKFKAIKKDINNKVENYIFEQSEDFDRGALVGGFYYHSFFENPVKNKIKTFSKADIDKRKPDKASPEFWGGMKDKWEFDPGSGRNKIVGKEQVEGWYDEMAFKTVYKAAFKAITIDSEKIDANYLSVIEKENESRNLKIENEVNQEITTKANKNEIGFKDEPPVQNAEEVSGPESKEPKPNENGEVVEDSPSNNTLFPETNSSQEKAPF